MDQTTLQAMNVIQQILEGLSVENKLMALGAVSALEIANHHIGRDEKNELSQRFATDYDELILSSLSPQGQDVAEIDAIAALKDAEPYVEICHCLITQKELRADVWRVLKQVRAAIAAAPAKQEG